MQYIYGKIIAETKTHRVIIRVQIKTWRTQQSLATGKSTASNAYFNRAITWSHRTWEMEEDSDQKFQQHGGRYK